MPELKTQEDLMVWIMNQLAAKLPNHAILKGGMLFRLLDSPRPTNDLDYVFVPYRSKKNVLPLIEEALSVLDGLRMSATFHSTAVRIIVTYRNLRVQVEANVADECPSEEMSTVALAAKAGLLPQIIRVMRYDVALAHKLAAWNERALIRDLYDAHFLFSHLKILPDHLALERRLRRVQPAKALKTKSVAKSMTLAEFWDKLETKTAALLQADINAELSPILAKEELAGLERRIKASLFQLIEKMRLA